MLLELVSYVLGPRTLTLLYSASLKLCQSAALEIPFPKATYNFMMRC